MPSSSSSASRDDHADDGEVVEVVDFGQYIDPVSASGLDGVYDTIC